MNCKEHNTDYRTKFNKPYIQKRGNEFVIWFAPNQCRVYKQLSINFELT